MDKDFLKKLFEKNSDVKQNLISQMKAQDFAESILAILFAHFSDIYPESERELELEFQSLKIDLIDLLLPFCKKGSGICEKLASCFLDYLPELYTELMLDAEAIEKGDPAARSVDEVIISYPGFYAIGFYRIAHWFYKNKVNLLPRIITEHAHKITGIDIHPGATIGRSFCIDHGTGIVIGESSVIGDNVKIYQGVTLGGLTVQKEMANSKRHPTIEDGVVIYAGSTILGGETVIGASSIIGGNVWLTESVPKNSKVYHKGEVILKGS